MVADKNRQDGITSNVISALSIPGVAIQIVDYNWDARTEIVKCDPRVQLCWRISPTQLKTNAIVHGRRERLGQLMLHPADVPLFACGADESEDVRTLVCRFDREWLNTSTNTALDWSSEKLGPCFDLRNSDISHAMRRLTRELTQPGFCGHVLAESVSSSVAVDLARLLQNLDSVREDSIPKGGFSEGRLRQIREYIEDFDCGTPRLSDVACHCDISVAHLRRLFKAATGQTVYDFIEEVRVRKAKALLMDSTLPLKVISHKLGFCHPSGFSFAFKKVTGEAPRDFRHRYGGGVNMRS